MTIVLTAILGLVLGSFMNMLIDRVPAGRSVRGRSMCDRCRRMLRWWELVPVVSAMILRHRCPTCRGTIPFRNTVVEVGSAGVLLLVLLHHGGVVTPWGIIEAFGLLVLGVLAVIDLRHGVVPDQISVPAIVIVVVGRLVTAVIASEPKASVAISASTTAVASLLIAMVLGGGFFALQRLVSRGRWVGDGDIRVGALMGALLAPASLLLALATAYIIGGAYAGALLATRRAERGAHIPLVPFLFLGTLVSVLWGSRIIAWYGLA